MECLRRSDREPRHMKHKEYFRYRKKIVFCMIAIILMSAYICICVSMRLMVRDTSFPAEECLLYYAVNVDGMKGLGHSVVMLVDGDGRGTVFSFNGMQRTLGESLLGQSGVGKMSMGTMAPDATEAFLRTGNLNLDADQLSDNYDIALYRPVTKEEYDIVVGQAAPYFAAGEQFAMLYEQWGMEEDADRKAEYAQALEQMGKDESLPLYQIYTHNCDHAARIMIAPVDSAMQEYMRRGWRMTPNGNLKVFGAKAEDWGVVTLGEQSLPERILMFLVIF